MTQRDPKHDALRALLGRRPRPGWDLGVELVAVTPGCLAARAGGRGRWVTVVLSGSVSTTVPPREIGAGEALVHDGSTALITATGAVLLTADARHEVATALLSSCPTRGRSRAHDLSGSLRP